MTQTFERSELMAGISSILDGLAAKHPGDQSSFTFLRKAIVQLAEDESPRADKGGNKAKDSDAKHSSSSSTYKRNPELGKAIAANGKKVFDQLKKSASVATVLPLMRPLVPELPEDDHAAKVAITRAFMAHKNDYVSMPGELARDPLRWYVKR